MATNKRIPSLVVHAFSHFIESFGKENIIDFHEKTNEQLLSDIEYIEQHPELESYAKFWENTEDEIFMDLDTISHIQIDYKNFEVDKTLPPIYQKISAINLFLSECNFEGFYGAMYNFCALREDLKDFIEVMDSLFELGYRNASLICQISLALFAKKPELISDGQDMNEHYEIFSNELESAIGESVIEDFCSKLDDGSFYENLIEYIKTNSSSFFI